jgi:hypothetical protein
MNFGHKQDDREFSIPFCGYKMRQNGRENHTKKYGCSKAYFFGKVRGLKYSDEILIKKMVWREFHED